jgi:hypothetical protein
MGIDGRKAEHCLHPYFTQESAGIERPCSEVAIFTLEWSLGRVSQLYPSPTPRGFPTEAARASFCPPGVPSGVNRNYQ